MTLNIGTVFMTLIKLFYKLKFKVENLPKKHMTQTYITISTKCLKKRDKTSC